MIANNTTPLLWDGGLIDSFSIRGRICGRVCHADCHSICSDTGLTYCKHPFTVPFVRAAWPALFSCHNTSEKSASFFFFLFCLSAFCRKLKTSAVTVPAHQQTDGCCSTTMTNLHAFCKVRQLSDLLKALNLSDKRSPVPLGGPAFGPRLPPVSAVRRR